MHDTDINTIGFSYNIIILSLLTDINPFITDNKKYICGRS